VALRRPLRRHVASTATWASAVERYRRAVERYHVTLRTMPDRALRRDLEQNAGPLEATLEDFEDALAQRQHLSPDRDAEVLGSIHRAATLCAHATEAALMANEAAWRDDDEEVARCAERAAVLVKKIDELGDAARPHG
jgi:uncharacterized membrane protein YccC